MSILKTIYNRLHPAEEIEPLSTPESQAEAASALKQANTDLVEVIRKEPVVNELVEQLRAQMDRNHFGELVEAAMRRKT